MEKDGALKPAAAVEVTTPEPTWAQVQWASIKSKVATPEPMWAQAQWASIKSKACGASDYVMLRTRQGISMFGEPKLGSLFKPKEASAKDESLQSRSQ